MSIKYRRNSDVTKNLPKDKTVLLPHVCNDVGAYGAGVALAIAKTWDQPRKRYLQWYKELEFDYHVAAVNMEDKVNFFLNEILGHDPIPFVLGQIQPIPVAVYKSSDPTKPYDSSDGLARHYVVNMIGQRDIRPYQDMAPIRYEAIMECLMRLNTFAQELKSRAVKDVEIHMPQFGAGLAGGDWFIIEKAIEKFLADQENIVHVLDK